MNNTKDNRIPWIDTAKGISIFMIVLGHSADKSGADNILLHLCMFTGVGVFFLLSGMTFCYAQDSRRADGHNCLHVAAFPDEKGYPERQNNVRNSTEEGTFPWFSNRPFRVFLQKLWKRVIFPYLLWSMISILIYAAAGPAAARILHSDRHNFSIADNFLGMLYANSGTGYMEWNRPLWFLPCLTVVELVWYALLKMIAGISHGFSDNRKPEPADASSEDRESVQEGAASENRRSEPADAASESREPDSNNSRRNLSAGRSIAAALLYFIVGIILPLVWFFVLDSRGIRLHLPWEAETAICVMPYFGIGRLIRAWTESWVVNRRIHTEDTAEHWIFPALSAAFLVLECFLLSGTKYADFRADRFSDPGLFLPDAVIGVLFTLTLAAAFRNGAVYKVLRYMGRRTMAILVMHKFPVMACKVLLRKWPAADALLNAGLPGMIAADLIIAVLSVLLCLLFERLISRIAPWAFGRSRQPHISR